MLKNPKKFSCRSCLDQDIEGYAGRLKKFPPRIKQLSRGPFHGKTVIIELSDITLVRRISLNRYCSVSRLPNEAVFVFPLSEGTIFANGRVYGNQHQLASAGNRDTHVIFPQDFDHLIVAIPLTCLHHYLPAQEAALFFEVLAAIETNILIDKGRKATLTARLMEIFSELAGDGGELAVENIDAYCKQMVGLLFEYVSFHKRVVQVRSSNHEKILQRALTLIEANPARMFSLDELAREIFASKRCVQYAFSSILGLTPMSYIKKIRLNLIRQELKIVDSSSHFTSIISKYSFTNAGRISKEYAEFFGERPKDIQRNKAMPDSGDESSHD